MPPPPRSAFPFFRLFARVVAAPGFFQLVRAPVPLLFQALFVLLCLPPLPPFGVALLAAVRHAGLRLRVFGADSRPAPLGSCASGGVVAKGASVTPTTPAAPDRSFRFSSSLGWLRRHASHSSSNRRFLSRFDSSRRLSSASLAFLLSLRSRSRSARRSVMPALLCGRFARAAPTAAVIFRAWFMATGSRAAYRSRGP